MRVTRLFTAVLFFLLCGTVQATTYGSVEPIANPAVIDTGPLRDQPLKVREAFATRLLQCGIVDQVVDALSSTGAITTINGLNTQLRGGGWRVCRRHESVVRLHRDRQRPERARASTT